MSSLPYFRGSYPTQPNQWTEALAFIAENYEHDPPDFRSSWYKFLRNNNKKHFYALIVDIIKAILAASASHDPSNTSNPFPVNPAPFWWLLLHVSMLILAPMAKDNLSEESIKNTI